MVQNFKHRRLIDKQRQRVYNWSVYSWRKQQIMDFMRYRGQCKLVLLLQ